MGLTINDDTMTSDYSPHTARRAPGQPNIWQVSWLPGRRLDRNTAITAMILTDVTSSGDIRPGHRLWPHAESWAAELGLTAPAALAATADPPAWADPDKAAEHEDPEAGG